MPASNTIRIIGGKWRGRKLSFPSADDLRPTHDRVRETLFNWLMIDIAGARCLDLFAGSGALGFEALSRGASHVTFVDSHAGVTQSIQSHVLALKADNDASVLTGAYDQVNLSGSSFDIVFLDPPFKKTDYTALLGWCEAQSWLGPEARVYLEKPRELSLELSSNWVQSRHKSTSTLDYYLLQHKSV